MFVEFKLIQFIMKTRASSHITRLYIISSSTASPSQYRSQNFLGWSKKQTCQVWCNVMFIYLNRQIFLYIFLIFFLSCFFVSHFIMCQMFGWVRALGVSAFLWLLLPFHSQFTYYYIFFRFQFYNLTFPLSSTPILISKLNKEWETMNISLDIYMM